MNSASKHSKASGFTLIELMVAMGITAIIITILVTVTGVATDTWTRSRAEIRASRQAKAMLETMAKDFESLVSRRGNNFEWLNAEMQGSNLPNVTRNQGGANNAAAVTFLTAATDRYLGQVGDPNVDNGGDVSCVSYRLRFQDPISGGETPRTSTFVLYRLLVNPDETFANLLGQPSLRAAFQGGYEAQINQAENFICENVHQFSLTFHVEISRPAAGGGAATTEIVRVPLSSDNPNGSISLTGNGLVSNIAVDGVTQDVLNAGRLRAVEISMSVLSDTGITRMNGSGQGLRADDYARNVYHYSRMVELPGM